MSTEETLIETDRWTRVQAESLRNLADYFEKHPEMDRVAIIEAIRGTADLLPSFVRYTLDAVVAELGIDEHPQENA